MPARLTAAQLARWERTRAKGQRRVLLEQWIAWTIGVGVGGPTLRALVRGGRDAVKTYWLGSSSGLHIALAVLFGGVLTYIFGVASWNRMERLYAEATSSSSASGSDGGNRPHP